jgi:hypothetical protein
MMAVSDDIISDDHILLTWRDVWSCVALRSNNCY